ncbi:MAG: glycosyltransferase family 39 protein [Dehalococcoidia bacterium]|nr:glycosyltransferase family 39 protein [Dehalococcoidia bacterium]
MQKGVLAKLQRHLMRPRSRAGLIIAVLAVSLILRLLLFRLQGYYVDEACFSAWFNTAAEKGLHAFYDATWCDYPPFNIYIFWVFGKLAHAMGPDSLSFLIKLPQNLFDLATAFLIFHLLRQRFSFKVSLAVMAAYAFNPATIFNLAVWGQMDSIYTFFLVASLVAVLGSKYELSGGLLSLAILTKPQSIVLLPVIAYVILRNGGWQRALSSSAVFGAIIFLVILPFNWDNPIAFLVDRYAGYNLYPYNSINAYNFWALLGFWKLDTIPLLGLTYQIWGVLAFLAFVAFVMWQLHRRYEPRVAIFAVFLLMFGFFMLMTRMHERYLFPVFAFLAMSWSTRLTPWIYLGLTGTYFANLAYVLSTLNADSFIQDGHWSIFVLGPANAILLGLSLRAFYRMQRPKPFRSDDTTLFLP